MHKEIFFNRVLIHEKVTFYQQALLDDFLEHPAYKKLLNSLFYPEADLSELIAGLKIFHFMEYSYNGKSSPSRMLCALTELDNINFLPTQANIPDKDYLFPSLVIKKSENPSLDDYPYFIISDGFVNRVDDLLFEMLCSNEGGYKPAKKIGVIQKKINQSVSFLFNKKRRDFNFLSIEDYQYPDFTIEIDGKSYRITNAADLTMFLFFPSTTFGFFYDISHDFFMNEVGQIIEVRKKQGEPILTNGEKFVTVTNSEQLKVQSTKYIYYNIVLFAHYLKVFEKWFCEHLLSEVERLKEHE